MQQITVAVGQKQLHEFHYTTFTYSKKINVICRTVEDIITIKSYFLIYSFSIYQRIFTIINDHYVLKLSVNKLRCVIISKHVCNEISKLEKLITSIRNETDNLYT